MTFAFLSLFLAGGCFDASGEGGFGCSTVGERGVVEFDFDYPVGAVAARNGRTWAVGAVVSLTVRLDETGDPLEGVELRSSDTAVLLFAPIPDGQPEAGPGRAFMRVVGTGRAELQVYRDAELLDFVEVAAAEPAVALTATAIVGFEQPSAGRLEDGLGEPGVVLVPDGEVGLRVRLADAGFDLLEGTLPITAESTNVAVLEVVDALQSEGSPSLSLTLRAHTEGDAEIVYRFGALTDRFPVSVKATPEVATLQLHVDASGYGAYSSQAYRTIGQRGDTTPGYVVPRAFDRARWPIHGLQYVFTSPDGGLSLTPEANAQLASFLPNRAGDVKIRVETQGTAQRATATATYYVE